MDDLEKALMACEEDDFDTAVSLLTPLAESGNPKAQYNLGVLNFKGKGVPYSGTEAARLYSLSSEQGYVDAQNALGVSYRNGWGIKKDNIKAFRLFSIAAERGFPPAQFNLGLMYHDGADETVKKDSVLAYMWISLCASGHKEWGIWMKSWISKDMSREEVAEAQRLAEEWKEALLQTAT